LHDNIIQSLYATGLTLQDATLTVEKDAARAKHRIDEAIRALDGTIGDIRNYILDLRRETGAWQTDLGELVRAFRLQTLMDIELVIDSKPVDELKSKEGKELLAIVREALTNVAKHAAATQARVVVMHPNESTQVEIIDNGIGMERNGNGQSSHEGLGLRNMRERAKLIGGRLEINSAPQQGTTVRLIIPKSNESNGETE
jgi:signal transduction histidine kinase